jgi:NADH-quinone oxidoreductase subunit N
MNFAIPHVSWLPLAPEALLMVATLLVLGGALFLEREEEPTLLSIAVAGTVAAGITLVPLWSLANVDTFGGMLTVDHYAIVVAALVLLTGAASLVLAADDPAMGSEFMALVLLSCLGMVVFAQAANLITIFLGLEILSLPLYVLSGIHRDREASREAAVKYLLLGAFSSGVMLYGMALVYAATGTTFLSDIGNAILAHHAQALADVGLALMVVGFGFKLALVPFHMWTPDVYTGAPTPVTAFMSVATKAAAFAALMRFVLVGFPGAYLHWQTVLEFVAVLTIVGGNLMALRQRNLKRMMAYSGIAHAGYLVVALTSASVLGIVASLYYLLAYTFMNLGAFAVIIGLSGQAEEGADLDTYRGLFFRRPLVAAMMTVFLLSLASIPTTGGFLGKLLILLSAVHSGQTILAVAIVVGTMISLYYYFGIVRTMFDRTVASAEAGPVPDPAALPADGGAEPLPEDAPAPLAAPPPPRPVGLPVAVWVVAVVCLLGTFQMGLVPNMLLGAFSHSLLMP